MFCLQWECLVTLQILPLQRDKADLSKTSDVSPPGNREAVILEHLPAGGSGVHMTPLH